MDLAKKKCIPCEAGLAPMTKEEAEKLSQQVQGWHLGADGKHLSKEFRFENFLEAMAFANKITAVAESEGHHPDLSIGWGRVGVELSTHAIKGLSENDFILAAKIDEIQ
ncbi:MAG: 4a-hydroxytetrahydrobiopterin dehydratase [Candidatus Kaiserbacteria bacterium]|nr:MAG: 4a-hydroxytetrahydrobiopterin dehydratase [Candidatus Kaiserbacteria bacterium]